MINYDINVTITCLGKAYVARIPIKRNTDNCNPYSVELDYTKSALVPTEQKQNSEKRLD